MRAARKPSAVARELLRNFPKSGGRRRRRKRKGGSQNGAADKNGAAAEANGEQGNGETDDQDVEELEVTDSENGSRPGPKSEPEELEATED